MMVKPWWLIGICCIKFSTFRWCNTFNAGLIGNSGIKSPCSSANPHLESPSGTILLQTLGINDVALHAGRHLRRDVTRPRMRLSTCSCTYSHTYIITFTKDTQRYARLTWVAVCTHSPSNATNNYSNCSNGEFRSLWTTFHCTPTRLHHASERASELATYV